ICEQLLIGASTHSGQPGPCDELGTALRLASDRDELDPVGAQNRRDHDLARDIRGAEDSHAQGGHGPERTLGGMAVLLGIGFLAGVITAVSPCGPALPRMRSRSVRRPRFDLLSPLA